MTAYSGALKRSARFERYTPVAGVSAEHIEPDPEPDPFSPVPEGVRAAPYDVWVPQEESIHTEMQARPFDHWSHVRPPVGSGVPQTVSQLAQQARLIANHHQVDYTPDTARAYKHASEGRSIEVTPGRRPWQAGEEVPDGSAYLQAGTNAYDRTNGVTEVYSGDAANAGRYRLGNRFEMWGLYETPTGKFGLDTQLRATTGLAPQFPVDKPRLADTAPYTASSRGTDTWTLTSWQVPSLFSSPSETVMTDHEVAQSGQYFAGSGDFEDRGRL